MVDDNLAVLRFLEENPQGPYHGDDVELLQRWHGWGAAPQVFDRPEWGETRSELERLLGPAGMAAAARTTLNAHYTDPRLVEALWSTVRRLGVDGGVVLEPGCGAGGILAAAGPTWRGIGVELDPTTAQVAAARLDGRHEIVTGDFGRFPVVEGQASAVVGNVPFGQFAVFDPVYNADLSLSIHDHFLAKSAAALAPGGVAAVITSRYTLDSLSPAGRQAIGERADFIGALRLPGVAHEAYAGTRVVTDMVVLRGRAPGQPAHHAPGFLDAPERLGDAGEVRMSAYYRHHPDHLLGQVGTRTGQYGLELAVAADRASWADGLDAGVRRVVRAAPAAAPPPLVSDPLALRGPDPGGDRQPVGRIERTETGVFRRCGVDGWEPHAPGSAAGELTALLQLRDGAVALVDAEGDRQVPDALVEERRTALATAYDAYVQRYGPLNRVTITASGQRRAPKMGGFRDDPGWARVSALELYDESAGKAAPAGILRHRVLEPAEPLVRAESPAEALAVSLQRRGRLDEVLVAQLLAVDVDEVAGQLGDLAYRDPASARLVPATEYLSGNVRTKLEAARAVADADPGAWGRNVEALERVLPRDVTADELGGLLGAPWIARETVAGFACDVAALPEGSPLITVQRSIELGRWAVKAPVHVTGRLGGDHPYGTEHRDALQLIEDGLNGVNPVVWMTVDGDKRVVNPEATETARERLGEIKEHFDHWLLHDDPERSQQALAIYNERFNSYVPRDYTGMRIESPGLRSTFELRDHQHAAVARMLHGGNTLLAHPVGAGKTAEMIVGAMELKRVGTVNRPCFVVPNHMLEQFGRDIIDLYPAAEVLVISKEDVSPKGRAAFAARARSHDWDAVIVTHSSMSRWHLSPEVTARNLETKIDRSRRDLTTMQGQGDNRTLTKLVEKRMAAYQEKLLASRARIESRQDDHDLPFDRAGIDYVLVDEAHTYKNAEVRSSVRNLRGVPVGDGSQIAEDLGDKLAWLRQAYPDRPIATFATGTPISNTVAEMWVLGRYLRPDLLDELGIQSFDAFRAQFCETTSTMELDPSGTQ
ncbi:MAG TPA: DEAD/DEAH box helicase family protein, partial [Acidimicrobiales bacterium]|nr:DEAD/DEAH box helicase family protein [Acidimicrobiales bacterium]